MADAFIFILSGAMICAGFELWERGAGVKGSSRGLCRPWLKIAGTIAAALGAALYAAIVIRHFIG